jgi:hypothetical protein
MQNLNGTLADAPDVVMAQSDEERQDAFLYVRRAHKLD